jgi:hypothetical protein
MLRIYYYFLLFVFITTCSACRQSSRPDNETLLTQLLVKFPQLKKGKGKPTDYYKFTKSITLAKLAVTIQLFEPDDSTNDDQQIIIISNPAGQAYAIPLLSDKYKSFWNFQFDGVANNASVVGTTFEKEVNNALAACGLNKAGTGEGIISEIFDSLLGLDKLGDSEIKSTADGTNISFKKIDLPDDDPDSCAKRNSLNCKALLISRHPGPYEVDDNVFFDENSDRIFQIDFRRLEKKGVTKYYKIKVYRQGCIVTALLM